MPEPGACHRIGRRKHSRRGIEDERKRPTATDARRAFAEFLITESGFYGRLGRTERSERALSDSRAIWESLVQSDPRNEIDLHGLASVELSSYVRAGGPQSDPSLPHIRRALAIFETRRRR